MNIYFEFKYHDYYALITVESSEEIPTYEELSAKATEIYVDIVAGDSMAEILEEADPITITKELAFMKYITCGDFNDELVGKVSQQFEEIKNDILLIDKTLL